MPFEKRLNKNRFSYHFISKQRRMNSLIYSFFHILCSLYTLLRFHSIFISFRPISQSTFHLKVRRNSTNNLNLDSEQISSEHLVSPDRKQWRQSIIKLRLVMQDWQDWSEKFIKNKQSIYLCWFIAHLKKYILKTTESSFAEKFVIYLT